MILSATFRKPQYLQWLGHTSRYDRRPTKLRPGMRPRISTRSFPCWWGKVWWVIQHQRPEPFNQPTSPQVAGAFWTLNSSTHWLDSVFNPNLESIPTSHLVSVTHSTQFTPNLSKWWKIYYPAAAVATSDGYLGSRALDEKAPSKPLFR